MLNLYQELPTLDLANDCFRFVMAFFEVINTSVPHIYHSALPLCPKESTIQALYGPQAHPLVRVIQGLPTSWDTSIASIMFPDRISVVTWSPCNRFIALAHDKSFEVEILDAVTFKQLYTMYYPDKKAPSVYKYLTFSADSYLLTGYCHIPNCIITWDVQTGGLISNISTSNGACGSMVYSDCNTMTGGVFYLEDQSSIIIYDIISGKAIISHPVQESVARTVWSYEKCLQFATIESQSMVIWEVAFTSSGEPTRINSLPIPEGVSTTFLVVLPSFNWLGFILQQKVLVWDAQHHKILLNSIDLESPRGISFTPDGTFIICGVGFSELYVWKKSIDGFLLHQNFLANSTITNSVISPNGQSIASFGGLMLQLWHTNSPTSVSTICRKDPEYSTQDFLLEFSPDGTLVAAVQWSSHTITVLNVESGKPCLVIDINTEICGMRITEDKIVVLSDEKIILWDLPTEDCAHVRRNVQNSTQTISFEYPMPIEETHASVSPDLTYIAFGNKFDFEESFYVYNIHTRERLVVAESYGWIPGFTLDGCKVWCAGWDGGVNEWLILKEDGSNTTKLELLIEDQGLPDGYPFISAHGYHITEDGWILNSSGKHLLWISPHWQSIDESQRCWNGNFFAMWGHTSSEPIIFKFEA